MGLQGEVWMEVSEGLQWEGHSYSKVQQVQWHEGVRYLGVLKFRDREQQWEWEAGKLGRGQIMLILKV